ncbi:hypothetical protein GBA52_010284 [Prunus armeniaca]|nr:hypothetical protein GBA52_010284 [Prunus armeniaca]
MTHISAAGESDSAENDSCDSPLEPNSPLYGFSERTDPDSAERDESLQFRGGDLMCLECTSLSHSEPNIATSFWRQSRRKAIAEQRTASSSPEHPSFRARMSMLSGDRKSFRDYADDMPTSSYRSDGTSTSEARRLRRRSISITPEIGDDIVRAVRAMNETLKQNRLLREQGDDDRNIASGLQKNDQISSQKAISLPSSPHQYRSQTSERIGPSEFTRNDELVLTWNRILESATSGNRPLLPYQEWNIDFLRIDCWNSCWNW